MTGHALASNPPQPQLSKPSVERLISLDVFRGITIAGMILVNNPGTWKYIYGPLGHAAWHGWTPTDLVFPFFLFIVGVAIPLAFQRRLQQGVGRGLLVAQVLRRALTLVLLGLILAGFPDWRLIAPYVGSIVGLYLLSAGAPVRNIAGAVVLAAAGGLFVHDFASFQESNLRVPGVLQRIGLCYLCVSLIVLWVGTWGRAAVGVALLLGYWALVAWVAPPDSYAPTFTGRPEGLLHDWIDVSLLGNHLYRERPDPEGLLSTLPSIATVLCGVLTAQWMTSGRGKLERVVGLFVVGNLALLVGLFWSYYFPINKKIWTSSYVVLMAGLAVHFLAMCYWLIDVRGLRRWAWPFVVFGSNAIAVYVASGLLSKMLGRWQVAGETEPIPVRAWIYEHVFASWAGPLNGSLLFALTYVALWCLVLIPLYRYRIFIKV